MLPQDGDNRTMQKDLKSFACKPLGLTHKWNNGRNWWTGWHFAWLFSGYRSSGPKLWKNSICFIWTRTACKANMWAPGLRMSLGQKHPKAWWKYGSTKGYAGFRIRSKPVPKHWTHSKVLKHGHVFKGLEQTSNPVKVEKKTLPAVWKKWMTLKRSKCWKRNSLPWMHRSRRCTFVFAYENACVCDTV